MVDQAADQPSVDGNDSSQNFLFSPLTPPASNKSFPKSLKIAVWNCRGGLRDKLDWFDFLFRVSDCDLLILNETFRKPGTPWPSYFPPLLGESTNNSASPTRSSAGVAVVANPARLRNIKFFATLEPPAIDGTKVCLLVNNMTILAVYVPPSSPELLSEYVTLAQELSNVRPVVFCGDFNAHSALFCRSPSNPAGRVLEGLLTPRGQNSFFRANTGPAFTRIPSEGQAGSIIDFIFASKCNMTDSRCFDSHDWPSDHRPISSQITPAAERSFTSTSHYRLRLELLKDTDVRERYVTAARSASSTLTERILDLSLTADPNAPTSDKLQLADAMEKVFTDTILGVASTVLGKKRVPLLSTGSPRPPPSPEYTSAFTTLQETYRRLRSDEQPAEPLLAERDRLKLKLKSITTRDSLAGYRTWLQDTGSLPITQVMKIVRRIRRSKAAAGASLATTPVALASYRNHFAQQFSNPAEIESFSPPSNETVTPNLNFANEIFDAESISRFIAFSRDGKAPGNSGLCVEVLKPVGVTVSSILNRMFSTFFILGVVPRSWTRALVCPVPKKGDLSRIENYRPISLTETSRKLFELCLLRHLQPLTPLSREQGGFRSERSTIDQIEALDTLIKHVKQSTRRFPQLAFLDIKAAYDSVPRAKLWRRCVDIGYPVSTINSLRALFEHNSGQLVLKHHRSQPFAQPAGVLQGSILSPLLYSVYIDPLVTALRSGPLIPLGPNRSINCLLYADDIVLVGAKPVDLSRLLAIAEADSFSRGYRFSLTKCVVVSSNSSPQQFPSGATLSSESHFNYLGVEFTASGIDEVRHVHNRVVKLQAAAAMLKAIGARYLGFPRQCAFRLYKAFLRPGLEYGITLVRPTHASFENLEVAQRQALRGILGVHSNSNVEVVLALSNCPSMRTRRECLHHNRMARLIRIHESTGSDEHALCHIRNGLVLPPPSLPHPNLPGHAEIVEHFCSEPRARYIARHFGQTCSVKGLQLPMSSNIPWSESRMLILWLLRKFDCFPRSTPRFCLICQNRLHHQEHVSFCGGIISRLRSDPRIPHLPVDIENSDRPIEYTLALIEDMDCHSARPAIHALASSILAAVTVVFGSSFAI